MNDMFGCNASVTLNPIFDIQEVFNNETSDSRLPE